MISEKMWKVAKRVNLKSSHHKEKEKKYWVMGTYFTMLFNLYFLIIKVAYY